MNPDIYYYNPTCELAVANGSENFQAKALLCKFEYDLDILPAFFALPNDITLVHKSPSAQFTDKLKKAGIEISLLKLSDECLSDISFVNSPKGFLCPWGWSPAVHKLLAPLKASCSKAFKNSVVSQWQPIHRELYSRKQGVELLESIVAKTGCSWMPQIEDLPQFCDSQDEIINLQRRWGRVVVKSIWSSSGRGLQILRPGEYNQTNSQVISGFLNQQGFVIAEPWHKKLLDISFQFFSHGNGNIEFKGVTSFITDKSGKYAGSYIKEIPENIPERLKHFISEHLLAVRELLKNQLAWSPYSTEYYGWIGIDSIIYETENNKLLFHPCIEVNCRYTMGAVSLALRDHLADGSGGVFRIIYRKDKRIVEYFEEMETRYPLCMHNGKIKKGFLPLTQSTNGSLFGAYIFVSDQKMQVV
jgi:hypothetical protein